MAEDLDSRAQLAREICSMSSMFTACTHRSRSPRRPPFVDWSMKRPESMSYAGNIVDWLHPDKNRHPKAEAAFKVVSEAYECLSDETARRAFNSERQDMFCRECHSNSERQKAGIRTKLRRAVAALREAKKRFQEECRVIESCLEANKATQGGSPLFDPSVHLLYDGYPHHRDRVLVNPREQEQQFQCGDGDNHRRKGRCESPLYEIRTERRAGRTTNSSFRF
ncbi:heat shock protein DnaJ [Musa troglodytarum]|uniref:Heat shock protein DnaJ n=1 Tax=Musa troglodytarum TaxID=320322 RepID=A0A9E7JB61_9LILI|nr:heat shock protein DnaJ [Musa troglodytarum]